MSRIGKQSIAIPDGVEINIDNQELTVKGPKGELKLTIHPKINVIVEGKEIKITRNEESKEEKSLHGLIRSLVANMVQGVSQGFEKKLEINGVGYRANIQGKKIVLQLGFSHNIEYNVPEDVTVEIDKDKKNIVIISGIDKQKVGQVASDIRAYKKPEPYKGKGIKYIDEHIVRKAGKTASKGE